MHCLIALILVSLSSVGCGETTNAPPSDGAADAPPSPDATDSAVDGEADASVRAPDPTGFSTVGELSAGRNALTATLLEDGRVLLVGGETIATRTPLDAVDIFDPATGEIREAARLPASRANHAAVRLLDGRVLVIGGGRSAPIGAGSGLEVMASAALYDPARDAWEETGALEVGRSHFAAVALDDGRVLVAGGASGAHDNGSMCTGAPDCGPLGDTLRSAEIYDPVTESFALTGTMAEARSLFTMTHLLDGRVLAVAGMNDARVGFSSTEVFDPERGAFAPGPSLVSEERVFHAAAPLPSGRVLVGGGKLPDTRFLASVNAVDVDMASAAELPELSIAVTLPGFVPLDSGRVMSVGGLRCPSPCEPVADASIFDEETESWHAIAPLQRARAGHAAVRLSDGRVLVCGGFTATGNARDCEISTH